MRRRTFEHLDGEEAQAVQDSADSPHGALEQKDRGALLRRALMQLSTIHREVIDLFYYHEKSIEEVAVILQVPRTTVRTPLGQKIEAVRGIVPVCARGAVCRDRTSRTSPFLFVAVANYTRKHRCSLR
jgi:RNA polymerase sigma-70 factor (ECF subfamily)